MAAAYILVAMSWLHMGLVCYLLGKFQVITFVFNFNNLFNAFKFLNFQVTNHSARSATAQTTLHGFVSADMGGSCKFKIHARMPLLYLSSRKFPDILFFFYDCTY